MRRPQHAGCTGHVENCVTTVFSAYVTTSGQAWADFDVFMPERWAKDTERRRAAVHPGRPEAQDQATAGGRPAGTPAEGRPAGLPYVAIIPRDFRITLPSGAVITALHLRWSRWRRRHQARARWHHYSARLAAAAAT